MSTSSTSVSTPVSGHATTENESLTLAEEVKKYKTEVLIEFLGKEEDLELDEEDLEIIRKEKVNGRDFLKMTKQDFRDFGVKGGPALRLADFAKECKEKRK